MYGHQVQAVGNCRTHSVCCRIDRANNNLQLLVRNGLKPLVVVRLSPQIRQGILKGTANQFDGEYPKKCLNLISVCSTHVCLYVRSARALPYMPESLLGGTKNNSLMLWCMLHLCALSACLLFAWAARYVRRCAPMLVFGPLLGLGAWRPLWVLLAVVFVVVGLSREFFPITRVRIRLCLASGWVCVGYLCGGPALALCVGGCVFRVVAACCTEASPKPSLGWVSCLCGTRVVLAYVRGCLHVDSGSKHHPCWWLWSCTGTHSGLPVTGGLILHCCRRWFLSSTLVLVTPCPVL